MQPEPSTDGVFWKERIAACNEASNPNRLCHGNIEHLILLGKSVTRANAARSPRLSSTDVDEPAAARRPVPPQQSPSPHPLPAPAALLPTRPRAARRGDGTGDRARADAGPAPTGS